MVFPGFGLDVSFQFVVLKIASRVLAIKRYKNRKLNKNENSPFLLVKSNWIFMMLFNLLNCSLFSRNQIKNLTRVQHMNLVRGLGVGLETQIQSLTSPINAPNMSKMNSISNVNGIREFDQRLPLLYLHVFCRSLLYMFYRLRIKWSVIVVKIISKVAEKQFGEIDVIKHWTENEMWSDRSNDC